MAVLGIDASNIRAGGGVVHLGELLAAAKPEEYGFDRVVVWACQKTLARLPDRPWLVKVWHPWLERSLPWRVLFQVVPLSRQIKQQHCDVLFVPGGTFAGRFKPVVSMSQNLLPFDLSEMLRFGPSLFLAKLAVLRLTQKAAFRRADGVVFLTRFARDVVLKVTGQLRGKVARIHHGVDRRFLMEPRPQRDARECSNANPFRLLYVSDVWPYKHQWAVVEAVARLRTEGYPIELDLVGAGYPPSLRRLDAALREFDPGGEFVHCLGHIPYEQVLTCYQAADAFICASSCETFGQIVTEAMAAGLPVICSRQLALQELLGEAGEYFDLEDGAELAATLKKVIDSKELRTRMARDAYELAEQYSWTKCADETIGFISSVAGIALSPLPRQDKQ